jgi:hypothetical protein
MVEALKVRNDVAYVPSQYANFLLPYTRRIEAAKISGRYFGMSETVWYW